MEVLDLVMGYSLCKMGCEGYLGNSLLHYAAEFGNVEMMEYIIESGTPAGIKNYLGETPLHLAAGAHIKSKYVNLCGVKFESSFFPQLRGVIYRTVLIRK